MAPLPKIRHKVKTGFCDTVETTFEIDSDWNFTFTFGGVGFSGWVECPVTTNIINLNTPSFSTECEFVE